MRADCRVVLVWNWAIAAIAVGLAAWSVSGAALAQDPAFEPVPPVSDLAPNVTSVELVDIDGDGDLDTLAATGQGGEILWFESDGDRRPAFQKRHVIASNILDARTATAADIDGDGDQDVLATATAVGGRVVWYRNNGGLAPTFTPIIMGVVSQGDLGGRVNAAEAADMDGDTDIDVVVSFYLSPQQSQGYVVWFENNGAPSPSFTRNVLFSPAGELENVLDIEVGDLDGNGAPDIVAVSETPGTPFGQNRVVWWKSTGGANPVFAYNVIEQGLSDPVSVELTDLGVGPELDVVVCAPGDDLVVGFLSSGGANPFFQPDVLIPADDPRDVESVDIEGDGDQDLVVALGTEQRAALYESTGGGQPGFVFRPLISSFAFCDDVGVGDIDGNGKPDVIAAFPGPGVIERVQQVTPILNLAQNTLHATFDDAISQANNDDGLFVDPDRLFRDPLIDFMGKRIGIESDGAFVLGDQSVVDFADGAALAALGGQHVVLDGALNVPPNSAVSVFSDTDITLHPSLGLPNGSFFFGTTDLMYHGRRKMTRQTIDAEPPLGNFANWLGRPIDSAALRVAGGSGFAAIGDEIGGDGEIHPAGLAVYFPDPQSQTGWTGVPVDEEAPARHNALATGDFNNDGLEDIATIRTISGTPELRVHTAQTDPVPTFASTTGFSGIDAQHLVSVDIDFDGDLDLVCGQGIFYNIDPFTPTFDFDPFPLISNLRSFGVVAADFDLDGGIDVAVHCEKRNQNVPGRVGFSLYVMWSDAGVSPSFTPILLDEEDYFADGTCDGQSDCYPIATTELDGLNTLSREDQNKDGFTDFFVSEDDGITLYRNLVDSPPVFTSSVIDSGGVFCNVTPVDIERDGDIDLICASQRRSRVDILLNEGGIVYRPNRAIRPLLRASDVSVLEVDSLGVKRLGVVAAGCDQVEIVELDDPSCMDIGQGAFIDLLGQMTIECASVKLNQGTVSATGSVIVAPKGVLEGEGFVAAHVQNAGSVRPEFTMDVAGNFAQRAPAFPGFAGTIEVDLRDVNSTDLLSAGGTIILTGGLVAQAGPNFVPDVGDVFTVVAADDIENGSVFNVVTSPSIEVIDQGMVTTGSLMPEYNDVPGNSTVDLGAITIIDPLLRDNDFFAIATPSDAVVIDITGGPNGEPDGFQDTIIAYETLPNQPLGGLGVFIGGSPPGADFDFQSLTLFSDDFVNNPIAVEAGDYDGDGKLEIAAGNSRDFNESLVVLLSADSSAPNPVFPAMIQPLILRTGGVITDMTTSDFIMGGQRPGEGLGARQGLIVLTDYEDSGVATAAALDVDGWDGCDIDVCDDPDSTDPIDIDGVLPTLIEGYAATSNGDNKVVVAANPAASPGSFITLAFEVGEGPTEIRAGDLDLDGFPDLVNINEVGGTVSVLVNTDDAGGPGGRNFTPDAEIPLRSDPGDPDPLPSSVALADLDEDGDLDIAVVSTNGAGERVVRQLLNQFIDTGTLTFSDVTDLPVQPVGVPLIVRSGDLENDSGGQQLDDDLVVYVDPNAESIGGRTPEGPGGHAAVLSDDPTVCLADVNGDGQVTPTDFNAWINAFNNNLPTCDQNGDGMCTPTDFNAWIINFNAGCP